MNLRDQIAVRMTALKKRYEEQEEERRALRKRLEAVTLSIEQTRGRYTELDDLLKEASGGQSVEEGKGKPVSLRNPAQQGVSKGGLGEPTEGGGGETVDDLRGDNGDRG